MLKKNNFPYSYFLLIKNIIAASKELIRIEKN